VIFGSDMPIVFMYIAKILHLLLNIFLQGMSIVDK
jgi:hypothetical protein